MKYFKLIFTAFVAAVAVALFVHAQTSVSTQSTFQYYDHNLSKGMCAQKIQDVQMYLVSKGYLPNDSAKYVTGYFGPATFKAVKKMQADNGITATGFIGPKTRAFLDVQYNEKAAADEAAIQEEIKTNPNYHATGLIPTAKCVYDKIPVAPLPVTN